MSRTCSATRSPPPSKRAVPTQASRSRSNATAHSLLCTGRPHLRAAPCVFCARNIWPRSLCLPGRGTHGWRLRRARAAFRSLLQTLAANAPRAGLVPEQTSCAGRRRHHLARYLGARSFRSHSHAPRLLPLRRASTPRAHARRQQPQLSPLRRGGTRILLGRSASTRWAPFTTVTPTARPAPPRTCNAHPEARTPHRGSCSAVLLAVGCAHVRCLDASMSTTFVRRDGSPAASGAAAAALLVFDITDTDSFDRVKSWVKELRKMGGAYVTARISQRGHSVSPSHHAARQAKTSCWRWRRTSVTWSETGRSRRPRQRSTRPASARRCFTPAPKPTVGWRAPSRTWPNVRVTPPERAAPAAMDSRCCQPGTRLVAVLRKTHCESPARAAFFFAEVVARGGGGGGGGGAGGERCIGGGASAGRGAVGGLIQLGAAADERRPPARHSDCCG